jgi:hypothetical protein
LVPLDSLCLIPIPLTTLKNRFHIGQIYCTHAHTTPALSDTFFEVRIFAVALIELKGVGSNL